MQVFDQDGNFKDKLYQFSRPSGIYIDKNDNLYVADSESKSVSRNHQDWLRGIRIGSLKDKDRKVTAFIPDPYARRHRHQRRRRRRRRREGQRLRGGSRPAARQQVQPRSRKDLKSLNRES